MYLRCHQLRADVTVLSRRLMALLVPQQAVPSMAKEIMEELQDLAIEGQYTVPNTAKTFFISTVITYQQ